MDDHDKIIHKIYQAGSNPEYWPDVGRQISELVYGGSIHLLLSALDTGHEYVSLFVRGDPAFAGEYLDDYAGMDFRVPRVMGEALGIFLDERAYVSEDEFHASAIHQELLPRYGIHKISGSNMSFDGCLGWFGISTRNASLEFENSQRRLLGRLTPHILSALRISKSRADLTVAHQMSLRPLDALNGGLFLFHKGTLVHANEVARKLLDGGFFVLAQEKLACTDPKENRRLAHFIQNWSDEDHDREVLLRHDEEGAAYIVRIHALSPRYGIPQPALNSSFAISIVEMNISASPSLEEVVAFGARYGLTTAEASAIHSVLNSTNLAALAESRGVSLYTVQQQLKSALTKMGFNSQKKVFQAFERYRIFGSR